MLLVPHRGPGTAQDALPSDHQRVLAVVRDAGEHGFANLKGMADPHQAPHRPTRATALLRALLVLTTLEVDR